MPHIQVVGHEPFPLVAMVPSCSTTQYQGKKCHVKPRGHPPAFLSLLHTLARETWPPQPIQPRTTPTIIVSDRINLPPPQKFGFDRHVWSLSPNLRRRMTGLQASARRTSGIPGVGKLSLFAIRVCNVPPLPSLFHPVRTLWFSLADAQL